MSREILFKAKRKDNGEWAEGCLLISDERYFIIPEFGVSCIEEVKYRTADNLITLYAFEVIAETVCQYTDLTDKSGKRIWENDITKLVLPNGEVRYFKVSFKKVIRKVLCHPDFDDVVAKVELNAICFEWNGYELFPCIDESGVSDVSKMEVIGNIFDNTEELEKELKTL